MLAITTKLAGGLPNAEYAVDFTYADYLRLHELLSLQLPRTNNEHELPFIVVHQSIELFFKCALSVNERIIEDLNAGRLEQAFERIVRTTAMLHVATAITKYLEVMNFQQFASFRPALGSASGIQSHQFRELERQSVQLKQGLIVLLQRRELLSVAYETEPAPEQAARNAISRVYGELESGSLREIFDALYEYDDTFSDYRWQHLKVVRRQIGFSQGTGGSAGIAYLEQKLSTRFFSELVEVRAEVVRDARSLEFPGLEPI